MGVQNVYMLSTTIPTQVKGGSMHAVAGNFETLVADDIDTIYRLCRLPANAVILGIEINNDAIAGLTDADIGLYETIEHGGAVKDADVYMDGTDLNAGSAIGSEVSGLSNIAIDAIGDQVYENAGDTIPTPGAEYDLCMTVNSEITGAGTIAIRVKFAISS